MRYLILVAVFAAVMLAPKISWAGGPPGSYRQTCKNIKVRGNDLYARCQDGNGGWVDRRLENFQRCVGDINNVPEGLTCNHEHNRGQGPQGSYSQTCREIYVEGDRLYAKCEDGNGGWKNASLREFQRCRGDISNQFGRLTCDQGRDHDHDHDHH